MRLRLGRSRNKEEDEENYVSKVDSETLFLLTQKPCVRVVWVVEGHSDILVTQSVR